MIRKIFLKHESYKSVKGVMEFASTDSISGKEHMDITTGRNDHASLQIVLSGDEEFIISTGKDPCFPVYGKLENIRIEADVSGISKENITLQPVGFIDDDDQTAKSDMLLNDEIIYVSPFVYQPVWLEVAIGKDTAPKEYEGTVKIYSHRMFEAEALIKTLTFSINVRDVLLPEPKDYSFHLDLWQHPSNIARKHEAPLWSDEHFAVLEEYIKSLSQLGQKAVTVIATQIPWSGQYCFAISNYPSDLFEYAMSKVIKETNGSFIYDFTVMERYINLCFKYGIDKEIEIFGLINIWVSPADGFGGVAGDFPDALRIRYLDKKDGCYKYMDKAEDIERYIKALESFIIQKGWLDITLVAADEPSSVALYRERLNNLKKIAPSFKYKAAINHVEFINEFKDEIDDYVPALTCVCEDWDLLENIRDRIKGRLLWYVCCVPKIPNTFISSDLLEARFIGILSAYMKMDGFLRWNYTVWPQKPKERLSYKAPLWKSGDTNFVYPANNGRPLLSLRYKNLKRGIEDFELINLLIKNSDTKDPMLLLWEKVIKTFHINKYHPSNKKEPAELFSLDPDDYDQFRDLLFDAIDTSKQSF